MCGNRWEAERVIVVVMGVSGSGKSTLAAALVAETGWDFAEGDEYHSPENRAKMNAGTPLTDADRGPWLDALHAVIAAWNFAGVSGILTCSALKRSYRERLVAGLEGIRFVWLDPPRTMLEDRLHHRTGHYMNPNLLGSQLDALEPPGEGEALRLTGGEPVEQLAAQVLKWVAVSA